MRSVRDGTDDDSDGTEGTATRPRVLCVSSDRSTRAALALALADEPVDVTVAETAPEAAETTESDAVDGILLDARVLAGATKGVEGADSSLGDRSGTDAPLLETLESEARELPTLIHWGLEAENGAERDPAVPSTDELRRLESRITVLTEGERAATDDAATVAARLARAIVERVYDGDFDRGTEAAGGSASGGSTDRGDGADDGGQDADLESIVAAVRRRLADVTSPLSVEASLREEFTGSDRFAFAWVGEYDRGEGEIVPWITDSSELEWPLQRTFGVGTEGETLLQRAVRSRELQVVEDLARDSGTVPLGERAAKRGVDAVVAAPLVATERRPTTEAIGDLYGVFVVYVTEGITDADRDAIREVARVASHVLETIAVRGRLEQQERILERYERLVETAGDGMCVLDEQGHFMTVNEALTEMTGYSREGLLGEHVSLLFGGDDIEAGKATVRSLLASDESTDTVELTLERKDGRTIPCEGQIAVLGGEDDLEGIVGVVRDITERKRSERKLREQNERLDAFARVVSHDLRNPLSVSQGYLDLIEETGSLEHVEQIRDGLDRMEGIIDDVLSIARGGDWAAEPEPVTLEEVAAEAWDHVSTPSASFVVHESSVRPDGETPFEADRGRLLRLFENLFRNSVEHGGSDVTVRTGPLEDGGTVTGFFVADDGSGLPEELRERENVFDPSVSSSSEGLGIGLWVVREVATGHGWSVTAAESRSGGARFEFRFEFAADRAERDSN